VILGDAEVQSGKVSVKPLRRDGAQQLLPLAEAINEMR
jgi:histidyl-tRNA synthetase